MRDVGVVRTILDIDGDVLQAAKELADHRKTTAGKVLSELARQALEPTSRHAVRNGVPAPAAATRQPQGHDAARQPSARRYVSRSALLDVNVIVALFDPNHVHHEPAHRWFAEHLLGLATAHGGCLATFDRCVALKAVRRARPHNLLIIEA